MDLDATQVVVAALGFLAALPFSSRLGRRKLLAEAAKVGAEADVVRSADHREWVEVFRCEMESMSKRYRAEINDLKVRLDEMEAEIAEREAAIKERDGEIERLEGQVDRLSKRVAELSAV